MLFVRICILCDFAVILSDRIMSYNCVYLSVMTQISTSVKQRTEDVVLMPSVLTLSAASSVRVNQDTQEMESFAQVNYPKMIVMVVIISLWLNGHVICSLGSTYKCIS